MKFWKKIKEWFAKSNRGLHARFGILIFVLSLLFCAMLDVTMTQAILVGCFVVFGCAITAEEKDKRWGGEFDWNDVLATMIVPILALAITLIVWLCLSF